MRRLILGFVLSISVAGVALAAETPQKRAFGGLPKGSYSGSCSCALSGGIYLNCYCNNLQSKMFETTMDTRECHAPKDIKNCDGRLTCTDSSSTQCPDGH